MNPEQAALIERIAYTRGWQLVLVLISSGLLGWLFTTDDQLVKRAIGLITAAPRVVRP